VHSAGLIGLTAQSVRMHGTMPSNDTVTLCGVSPTLTKSTATDESLTFLAQTCRNVSFSQLFLCLSRLSLSWQNNSGFIIK
jgi:hypothetical protein